MSKVAVVFWSGTGNTEAMANQVVEGAKRKGAEVDLFTAAEFEKSLVATYDAIAFGCPSMGVEQLEDSEFEPMFEACLPELAHKNIALFGSYGWGDGQWMSDWVERMKNAGATVVGDAGVICQDTPDDNALSECEELGKKLVYCITDFQLNNAG